MKIALIILTAVMLAAYGLAIFVGGMTIESLHFLVASFGTALLAMKGEK